MNKSSLVKFDFALLLSSCVSTMAMGIYTAQPWGDNYAYTKFEDYLILAGMLLWSISVYIALFVALLFFLRKMILIKTFTIGVLTISLLSCFILFDTIFIHIDAQGGLVFYYLPFYQWMSFFMLLFICAIVYKVSKEK